AAPGSAARPARGRTRTAWALPWVHSKEAMRAGQFIPQARKNNTRPRRHAGKTGKQARDFASLRRATYAWRGPSRIRTGNGTSEEVLGGPAETDNKAATGIPAAQTQGRDPGRLPQGGARTGTERGPVVAEPFRVGCLPPCRRIADEG